MTAPVHDCAGRGVIAVLTPYWVGVAEREISSDEAGLWPEEAAAVARAVATRRAEFAAGRALARQALLRLDGPQGPILAGADRAPVWPAGFTGSIAHCRGMAAAAVARTADARAIGIDVEAVGRFHFGLDSHILTGSERAALAGLDAGDGQRARAVIFAAKEAFYKCQYTISRRRLGFHDGAVTIDSAAGIFTLTLLADAPPFATGERFVGRFRIERGLVGAALWLPGD